MKYLSFFKKLSMGTSKKFNKIVNKRHLNIKHFMLLSCNFFFLVYKKLNSYVFC